MTASFNNKICLALDVDSLDKAKKLITDLAPHVGVFKVGKELFTRVGPAIVDYIHQAGGKVFLDLKYHDIPNTVQKAALAACDLGVFMFNVHAGGGTEMMQAAAEGVKKSKNPKTIVLGVTVLTSINQQTLNNDMRVAGTVADHVVHLAKLAKNSGLSGVVASPQEIKLIRAACGKDFVILTPGVRPDWAAAGDQKRVMTPKEAIAAGADYIVIGRPITGDKDPVAAAKRILAEIS